MVVSRTERSADTRFLACYIVVFLAFDNVGALGLAGGTVHAEIGTIRPPLLANAKNDTSLGRKGLTLLGQ